MSVQTREAGLLSPDQFQARRHHEIFAELRATDPVHWHVDHNGVGFWCLTKRADVQMANRDADRFTVTHGFTLNDIDGRDPQGEVMRHMLPGMASDEHTRHRRIVNRGFTPRTLRLIEDHLARKARVIVDSVIERGSCDFVTDVAAKLPLQAICELVGVPEADRQQMFEWGNQMTGIDDPEQGDLHEGTLASVGMVSYADRLRKERLADPRNDIITKLVDAEVSDGNLTSEEFELFFVLLVVAGNETTRNAMAHGMHALIEHPDERAELRADPSRERMERAVEEILRWATPVHYFRRTATTDVEIRGKQIMSGDRVVLWYASANRDEDAFAEPFHFDVDRSPNDHVTFGGGGPHFCLGANLARMELRLMFTELLTRMPDLELAGAPSFLRSNFINGIKSMPVRWDAGT